MNLNLIKTFNRVAKLGSFTKAAKSLNQPKSRVSRAISSLEEELGVQLIRRTTRQTNLTTAGKNFYNRTNFLIEQLEEEINLLTDSQEQITGKIRITAPDDVGQTILAKAIEAFSSQYPLVSIETIITNDYLDLSKDNIDLAFRAGKLTDSGLIQRKVIDAKLIMIASKKYLQEYGKPSLIQDLEKHKLILFPFKNLKLNLRPSVWCDSFPVLMRMCLDNSGITILPDFYCKPYLDKGEIVQVLPEWNPKKSSIHLVYIKDKNMPKRTRAFIETVLEIIN